MRIPPSGKIGGGAAFVAIFPKGYTSLSGKNLSRVHVAVVTNADISTSELNHLASKIAFEVPDAKITDIS